jgi:hypothetical protein
MIHFFEGLQHQFLSRHQHAKCSLCLLFLNMTLCNLCMGTHRCWAQGPRLIADSCPPARCPPLAGALLWVRCSVPASQRAILKGGIIYWGPCGGIYRPTPVRGRRASLAAPAKARGMPRRPPAGWGRTPILQFRLPEAVVCWRLTVYGTCMAGFLTLDGLSKGMHAAALLSQSETEFV